MKKRDSWIEEKRAPRSSGFSFEQNDEKLKLRKDRKNEEIANISKELESEKSEK